MTMLLARLGVAASAKRGDIEALNLVVGEWTPRGLLYGQTLPGLRIIGGDPNGHWEATPQGIQRAAGFTDAFDASYTLSVDTGPGTAAAVWSVSILAETADTRVKSDVAAATALVDNRFNAIEVRQLQPIDFVSHVFGELGQSQVVSRATQTAGSPSLDPKFWVGKAALQWGVRDKPGKLLLAASPMQDANEGQDFPGGTGVSEGVATALYLQEPGACPLFVNGAAGGTGFTTNEWGDEETLELDFIADMNAAVAATNAEVEPRYVMQHGAATINTQLANGGIFGVTVDEHIRRIREEAPNSFTSPIVMIGLTQPRAAFAPAVELSNEGLPVRTINTAFINIQDDAIYPREDDAHLDRVGVQQLGVDIWNVGIPAAEANVRRDPTPARNLMVSATGMSISATWDAPAFDGHPELELLYRVEMRPNGGVYEVVQESAERSFTSMMVTEGVAYDVRVTTFHGPIFEGDPVEGGATVQAAPANIEGGLTLTASIPVGGTFDPTTFNRAGTMLAVYDVTGANYLPPDMIMESGGAALGAFHGVESGTGDLIALSGSRDTGEFAEARVPAAQRPTSGTIGVYFRAGTATTPAEVTIYHDNVAISTDTAHPANDTLWTGGNLGAHMLTGGGGGDIGGQNTGSIPGGTYSELRLYEDQAPNLSAGAGGGGGPIPDEPVYAMAMPGLALAHYADATHFAVADGNWTTPGTWNTGVVPGPGDNAVILADRNIVFDDNSGARLGWVRVTGNLTCARSTDTLLFAENVITDPGSYFDWGREESPITANATIRLADNGDLDPASDATLLGRVFMNMGPCDFYGVRKSNYGRVAGYPVAGDATITLEAAPTNWNVGDQIVVAGTFYAGWNSQGVFQGHEDEERTIAAIDGAVVTLDAPLVYNHDHGQADGKRTIVANYTRNIKVETENGATAETHRRGHMMFMHPLSRLTAVEARWLGRTDKSFRSINDPADAGVITATTNLQGRYPFHWHRQGFEQLGWAHNCSVWTSPGVGMVHHSSWVDIEDCCTYATFGAGMFAEIGDEIGHWDRNAIIFCQGRRWSTSKNLKDTEIPSAAAYFFYDHAAGGSGMYGRGRAVKMRDNIVASANECYSWLLRGLTDEATTIETRFLEGFMEDALDRAGRTTFDRVPIHFFERNEGFAARTLMFIEKNSAAATQPLSTRFVDSVGWNLVKGVEIAYVGIYIFDNFELIGRGGANSEGFGFSKNVYGMVVTHSKIKDFDIGARYNGATSAELPITQPEWNIFEADNTFVGASVDTENFVNVTPTPATPFSVSLDALVYDSAANRRDVAVTGSHTDPLGTVPVPLRNLSGPREYAFDFGEVKAVVQNGKGYWVDDATGREWSMAYLVFTDRWTLLDYYVPVYFSADPGDWSTVNFFARATFNAGGLAAMYAAHPDEITVVPKRLKRDDWALVEQDGALLVDITNPPAEPITDLEYRIDFGPWTSAGATTDFTLTGLTNGEKSRVEIRPINGVARGEGSEAKNATPMAA